MQVIGQNCVDVEIRNIRKNKQKHEQSKPVEKVGRFLKLMMVLVKLVCLKSVQIFCRQFRTTPASTLILTVDLMP